MTVLLPHKRLDFHPYLWPNLLDHYRIGDLGL
jgi:hypothetical protein